MLAEIFGPALEQLAQNRRPPGEQEHQIQRAGTGAAMLVVALGWGALLALIPEVREQGARVMHGYSLSAGGWIGIGAGALAVVSGILMLLTGAKRARGQRDTMVAARALFWIVLAAALLWKGAFLPSWPVLNLFLATAYVWTLVAGATRFFLALRGMPAPRLQDAEELGLPVSGPASVEAAATGMSGTESSKPPRFRE